MGRLMKGQRLGHVLLSCLMTFHIPKERVLITRDDFGEYNKSRRRLGQHRQQRAEMHVFKLRMTQDEFDEEAQAIMERFRRDQNEREYTPRGEHSVRDHDRTLRSGRVIRVKEHKRGSGPVKSPRSHYETEPPPQRQIAAYLSHLQ